MTPSTARPLHLLIAALLCLASPNTQAADAPAPHAAIPALRNYLNLPGDRPPLPDQPFATVPLTKPDADAARALLWDEHAKLIRATRAQEMGDRKLVEGKLEMPFAYTIFGDKPKGGRSLFISMHGGGNAGKRVNDQQWENQKRLYKPAEGVYLAPRAPTDTWNLWHESHIDRMFARLIEDLIVFEDVNPDRVYLMGYSAGGDGVYQLAPRMADRFAAASMMAGHPNDASPLGLRNLPFAIHVGANDGGFKRNEVAAEWGKKLDALQNADPTGYPHLVKLHAGKAHWMDREDAEAVPWMMQHTRNPIPTKVVWRQASTTHDRFYWLAVPKDQAKPKTDVVATYKGQQITIEEAKSVPQLTIRLSDAMLDLDKPIKVTREAQTLFEGPAARTIATTAKTLAEYGDPKATFPAEIDIQLDK